MHKNRNPCNSFLMVKMTTTSDYSYDERRRTTWRPSSHTVTKSYSLGLQHISLILNMPIMFYWQLSYQEICWPVSRDHIVGSCRRAHQGRVFFGSWQLTKCCILFESRTYVSWTGWKQGWIVRKPVKARFHLKAVFTSLHVAFVPISRSRFKQRQIPPLRTFTNVLRFCVNFWMIFGHFVNDIFFSQRIS